MCGFSSTKLLIMNQWYVYHVYTLATKTEILPVSFPLHLRIEGFSSLARCPGAPLERVYIWIQLYSLWWCHRSWNCIILSLANILIACISHHAYFHDWALIIFCLQGLKVLTTDHFLHCLLLAMSSMGSCYGDELCLYSNSLIEWWCWHESSSVRIYV